MFKHTYVIILFNAVIVWYVLKKKYMEGKETYPSYCSNLEHSIGINFNKPWAASKDKSVKPIKTEEYVLMSISKEINRFFPRLSQVISVSF